MRVIQCLSGDCEVQALSDAWRELLSAAADCSVFQTPEWNLHWWRAFGTGQLHVLAERTRDGIAAVAPLFVRPSTDAGRHRLTLIGTGNSDRLDVLYACDAAAVRLAEAVETDAHRLEVALELRRLPRSSPLARRCTAGTLIDETPSPVLQLPSSADAVHTTIGHSMHRRVSYGTRRLAREGAVTVEQLHGDEVQKGLDELFMLHAARWRNKGEAGVLEDAGVQQFHRAVAASLDATGELRLMRMRAGGETAAVYYGFRTGLRECFYIAGFNPRFSAASPGALLLNEVLRRAIDEGVRVFDFLSGREPYKYEWGAEDELFVARVSETSSSDRR